MEPLGFVPYDRRLVWYHQIVEANPGILILVRVGDFYEAYGSHAELLASTCQITLTGRDQKQGARVPMSGVPYHSVERYLATCLNADIKVALVDEDDKVSDERWVVLAEKGLRKLL